MSDDTVTDQPPALKEETKPAAETETTTEEEDKPTPLPTLQESQQNPKEEIKTESFKKPMEVKSQPQLTTEEAKFTAKYGKVKPGGSDFLRQRLNKGVKYFDSGDYNMEKQSGKRPGSGKPSGLRPGLAKPPGLAGGRLGGKPVPPPSGGASLPPQPPLGTATGKTIPTPDSIPHRKQSTEISKLAV